MKYIAVSRKINPGGVGKVNDILANVSVAHLSSSRRFDTVPSLLHRVATLALSNPAASLITGNEGSPALPATPNS